jgi:hypothetical protein
VVERFRTRGRSFMWKGGRLPDGVYVVRAHGQRVGFLRRNGRFSKRPPFEATPGCRALARVQLSSPAFGGSGHRPLGITVRVRARTRVRVSAAVHGRVLLRRSRRASPARVLRLRLGARGVPAGDVRVSVRARGRLVRLHALRLP